MNLAHRSKKLIITGQSGTGKSTYFTEYVLSAFRSIYNRVYIFDHQGEFASRTGIRSALTPEDLTELHQTGMIVFDPSVMFPGETESAWNFFCEWVFARCQRNMGGAKLIAVDELQMFSSTSQLSWELSCVVETGRKFELDFCAITQQLNLVHNRLRNQATEIVTFRHIDKLILNALTDLGFDQEVVTGLTTGEYIDRDMTHSVELHGNIFSCVSPANQIRLNSDSDSECEELESDQEQIE
jgi:hypothetical protein